MTDGNSKLWAVVLIIIIALSISLGILWYKEDKNKKNAFKYEIYDHAEDIKQDETGTIPPSPQTSLPAPSLKEGHEGIKIAIIIDDLGWNKESADALLKIDAPISFSILPHLPFSKIIAEDAGLKNRDVLLHLPMEAHGYSQEEQEIKPLTDTMSKNDMEALIKDYISSIPHIVGVNNHMGSKFTENGEAVNHLIEVIKNKNLFFVDSRTTAKSLAYQTARAIGVKTAHRNVFLDNKEDEEYIKGQIEALIKSAQKNGSAIGIGHPHHQTISALQKMVAVIKEKGIEIVPVSELVN